MSRSSCITHPGKQHEIYNDFVRVSGEFCELLMERMDG